MLVKLIEVIAIWLMLASAGTAVLKFEETINSKEATLASETNSRGGHDETRGYGNINYVRKIDLDEDAANLYSTYQVKSLTNDSEIDYGSFKIIGPNKSGWKPEKQRYSPNLYVIAMSSPKDHVSHALSVYGGDIASNSYVNYGIGNVNTNFDIKADGNLKEMVSNGEGGKPIPLIETSLSGSDFSLKSKLSTEITPVGSSAAVLMNQLNKTEIRGENTVQDEEAKINTEAIITGEVSQPPSASNGKMASGICDITGAGCDDQSDDPELHVKAAEGANSPTEETFIAIGDAPAPTYNVSEGFVQDWRCGSSNAICTNFTHIMALPSKPIPMSLGGKFITYMAPAPVPQGI